MSLITHLLTRRHELSKRESGQAMSEYAMVLAGVAVVTVVSLDRLNDAIGALLSRVAASLS